MNVESCTALHFKLGVLIIICILLCSMWLISIIQRHKEDEIVFYYGKSPSHNLNYPPSDGWKVDDGFCVGLFPAPTVRPTSFTRPKERRQFKLGGN